MLLILKEYDFFNFCVCKVFDTLVAFFVVQTILNILSINENFPKADSLDDKTSAIFQIVAILLNTPTIAIFSA